MIAITLDCSLLEEDATGIQQKEHPFRQPHSETGNIVKFPSSSKGQRFKDPPEASQQEPIPPYSTDCEKGLLCSLLKAPGEVMKQCTGRIHTGAFYIPAHQLLFDAIIEWPHPEEEVDFVWLLNTLKNRKQLEELGGKEGLNEFYSFVHTAANADFYAECIAANYVRRQLIGAARQVIEASYDDQTDLGSILESIKGIEQIAQKNNDNRYRLSGRSLADFVDIEIDPKTNLLGNRYLTIGSGCFIIAPSGHGKSSTAFFMGICFAIGRVAFSIKPARPLRVLIVESEDDDGDNEKFAQVARTMDLSAEEEKLLPQNSRLEYRNDLTDDEFFQALDDWLTEWPTDLVIINPLGGFLMADLKDDEKVAIFLRRKLNTILSKHQCAALIIHHTPKTNFTKLENMQWYDWMYSMAGCAILTNWARAVLVIVPSKIPGTYRFIAAKRFDELQWLEREYWYSWHTEEFRDNGDVHKIISWVPANEDQILEAKPPEKKAGRPTKNITSAMIHEKMSPLDWKTLQELTEWAKESFDVGRTKLLAIVNDLEARGLLETDRVKRPGKRDIVLYRRKSVEKEEFTSAAENTMH